MNSTSDRLEGVFRFPLPADASISGFGMWIGSEYVEADVVERERARQIYQDILRRKKLVLTKAAVEALEARFK